MKHTEDFSMVINTEVLTQLTFQTIVSVAQHLCPIFGAVCIYTQQEERLVEVCMENYETDNGWDVAPMTWYNKELMTKFGLYYPIFK